MDVKLKSKFPFSRTLFVIVSVAMVLTLVLFWFQKKTKARDYREIVKEGVLQVVTDYNTTGYFVSGDSISGFQYELLQAMAAEWGIEVSIDLENSLDDNLEGLDRHRYDMVARNVPLTTTLKHQYAFTHPLILNKQVLIQRKPEYNDNLPLVRQHLDLAKKTIYVPKSSPAILRLDNLSHEIGDTIYVKEDDVYGQEQLVMMVAAGQIDFTVCDEKSADELARSFPEIDVETDIGFTHLESWIVRKDAPVLLDSLNAWLSRFRKTEEFERIYQRYYES